MADKEIAWSYSRLTSFETCPKKFWHLSVAKDYKEEVGEATNYGSEAHKHFENFFRKGAELPLDLRHHTPALYKISALKHKEILPEQQMAITRDFKPTGWFDDNVWLRAIADLVVVGENSTGAVLFDWKFGKQHDDHTQLKLMAMMLFLHYPDLKRVASRFYWAKAKAFQGIVMERDKMLEIVNELLPRVKSYEQAHKTTDFPPKQSGLCKRHCPVTSCPYNGGRG